MNWKKVSIIGAGIVGSNIAYSLMLKNIANEIALIDINEKLVYSEILDIRHGLGILGETKIHIGSYDDIKNSNLIIITAGRNRRPQETRLDVLSDNISIAKNIAENVKQYYKQGIVIVVSNPVDVITYQIYKVLELKRNLVFGTGCILDTSRFVFSIADYFNVSIKDVDGLVIGEHGDSQVCVWSQVNIKGMNINEYCKLHNIKFNDEDKLIIEKNVVNMGAEIISNKGKTHFGISTCTAHIADAILNDKSILASVSTYLNGEYGLKDVAISLPAIINKDGIKEFVNYKLSEEERNKLKISNDKITKYNLEYVKGVL